MRILHTSDNHGRFERIAQGLQDDSIECWLDTGDFFPNFELPIQRKIEEVCQREWFRDVAAPVLLAALNGRPVITVGGNHDFTSLAGCLREVGYPFVHEIGPDHVVELGGLKWAGFPHVPPIDGRWNNEVPELDIGRLLERVIMLEPDVLVTHTPPANIMAGRYGSTAVCNMLMYRSHTIRYHFFGHEHRCGGMFEVHQGICFYNGAENERVIDIV